MKRPDIPVASFEKMIDPFLNTAEAHPENPFLRIRLKEGFVTYTYQETVDRVRRVAHDLKKKGHGPGRACGHRG